MQCPVCVQDRWTPLHFAAQNGHTVVVEFLIKSGADVSATLQVTICPEFHTKYNYTSSVDIESTKIA